MIIQACLVVIGSSILGMEIIEVSNLIIEEDFMEISIDKKAKEYIKSKGKNSITAWLKIIAS